MRNSSMVAFALLFRMLLVLDRALTEPTQDKQALLSFLSQVPHENRLRWDASASACTWIGVVCDSNDSYVYSLRLPGVGLVGQIPPNTLGRLSQLRVLSLRSNRLSGQIPEDFSQLTLLRNVYLQGNQFSGGFPTSFTELTRLNRIDLSSNNFSGPIPFSLNNLTRLSGLFLQRNQFSGSIPSIGQSSLVDFNVSYNLLNGSIPNSVARFPASAFSNNLGLCGGPLTPCNPFFPTPAPSPSSPPSPSHRRRISAGAIAGISVASGILLLLLLLILLFLLVIRRRKRGAAGEKISKEKKPAAAAAAATGGGIGSSALAEAGTSSSKEDAAGGSSSVDVGGERNKLIFVGGGRTELRFDLEDLLRASAEVLGKGSMGTSYKAILEEGTTVVVKRLKDVGIGRKDFEQQMDLLGKIQHQNLLPLRAFYYSKDEKLLVYDYLPAGSLSALLHGSRGSGRSPLEWDTRLRIAQTAARGILHLHAARNVVHGNIKASNVLLKHHNLDACVSDFGLNPLFLQSSAPPNHRVMGYRAPEVVETRRVTFKSDVYSFGVLLLELLTGKAPNQASLGEEGIDLPRWVQSVVREEWTAEVFDVELMRHRNVEEEMVQLLQVGMACVATAPDQRPDMGQVVRMIEEMNRGDTDDGTRQSSDEATRGSGNQTPPAGYTP